MSNWSISYTPLAWKASWKGIPLSKGRGFPFLALMLGESKRLAIGGRAKRVASLEVHTVDKSGKIEVLIVDQSGFLDWFYVI